MARVDVEAGPMHRDRWLLLATAGGVVVTGLLPGIRRPLWLDEAASAGLAALPQAAFRRVILQREGNGVAHTLLLRAWQHVTSSDVGLRLPSLAFSAVAVVALTCLALTLFGRRTAFLVPPLLVGNPLYIRYAVEARTYALVLLMACLSGLLLVRAVRRDTATAWAAYGLLTGAAVYAHYFALLLPVGHGVAVVLRREPRPRMRGLIAGAAVYLVVISGLTLLVNHAGAGGVGYLAGSPLLRPAIWAAGAVTGTAVVAGGLLVARRRRAGLPLVVRVGPNGWPWLLVGSWLACPVLIAVLVSALFTPVLAPRYLVICLPPAVLLLAAGLARLPWALATAALTAGVFAAGLVLGGLYVQRQTENWPAAAHAVAAGATRDDGVLFVAPYVRLPFERYWPAARERERGVVPVLPALAWGSPPTRLFYEVPLPADRVAAALVGRPRVWLVLSHADLYGEADPALVRVTRLLRRVMTLRETREWRGVTVQLWQRSGVA